MPGLYIFCPFERAKSCPAKVSIQFGNHNVTNEVQVERQLRPVKKREETNQLSIAICLPAITDNMNTFNPYRYKYDRCSQFQSVNKKLANKTSRKKDNSENTRIHNDCYALAGHRHNFS